jgi:hypothetical protein
MVLEVHIPQKIHKLPNVLQAHIYVCVVAFVTNIHIGKLNIIHIMELIVLWL